VYHSSRIYFLLKVLSPLHKCRLGSVYLQFKSKNPLWRYGGGGAEWTSMLKVVALQEWEDQMVLLCGASVGNVCTGR